MITVNNSFVDNSGISTPRSDSAFEAESGLFAEELTKKLELREMYVSSKQGFSAADKSAYEKDFKKAVENGAVLVDLGENGAVGFMNDLERLLSEGKSFEEAITAISADYRTTERRDAFLIDPKTGEVIDSSPAPRCFIVDNAHNEVDFPTVKAIADDIATFIRYTAFAQPTDDSETVERLLSELKNKQENYDTFRFDPINDSQNPLMKKLAMLNAALEKDPDDKELEDEFYDIIDQLIKTIRRAQELRREGDNSAYLNGVIRSMKAFKNASAEDVKGTLQAEFGALFTG